MRHLITIKVPLVQDKINNRTSFDLYVSGFKAVESFPLPAFVVRCKQTIKEGVLALLYRISSRAESKVKIGATIKELSTTLSGFIQSVVKVQHQAFVRMQMRLMGIGGNTLRAIEEISEVVREFLRVGAGINSSGKIIQTLTAIRTELLIQLKQWDYKNPDGDRTDDSNKYLLSDLDTKILSAMDKK